MAFIYRYWIKDKSIRKSANLVDFSEDIINAIKEFYTSNLKDCRVEKDYYEYKLHLRVENKRLRDFGKYLLKNSTRLTSLWENRKDKNVKSFFVRKRQEYYAFINMDKDQNISSIELIDFIDFNDLDRLTLQAKKGLEQYIERYNIESKYNKKILDLEVGTLARLFYMDIFTLDIKKRSLNDIFKNKKLGNNAELLLIHGYHKNNSEDCKVISELDVDQLKNTKVSSILSDIEKEEYLLEDGFEISHIKKLNKDEVNKIKKMVNIHIMSAHSINKSRVANYKDINFIVHNVGQALSASLSKPNEAPFLYFDFGISEGANRFNRPTSMTIDINGMPSIVLSHIHKDHWYGITVFTKAFECDWYIPKQDLGMLFRKRCAEIILSGGSVNYIVSPIDLGYGVVFTSEDSKSEPSRIKRHKHDNGLAMKIKLSSKESTDVNILVSGDQRYDFISKKYLKEIDILVASHHGGEYSWSKKPTVSLDIPYGTGLGQIIYSCGRDNTHNHPSKVKDYMSRGWAKVHDTRADLDYILK